MKKIGRKIQKMGKKLTQVDLNLLNESKKISQTSQTVEIWI